MTYNVVSGAERLRRARIDWLATTPLALWFATCITFAPRLIPAASAQTAPAATASVQVATRPWLPIPPRFKPVAAQIVKKYEKTPLDNLAGGIAWGASYEMDGLLEMYRATGDKSYLDDFVSLGAKVLAARADVRHEKDWEGKSPKGWLTGSSYTVGVPYVLLDQSGQPALEVQTTARGGNNMTTVQITPSSDGKTFVLDLVNTFRKVPPIHQTFDGLTPQNVEARLRGKRGEEAYLQVKVLGPGIPRAYAAFTPPVGLVALHGHHTGRIVAPLAQFAAIVKADPRLAGYSTQAASYLKCGEEAMSELEPLWREEGDYGFCIFQPGIPFWSDGIPEPLNVQAASGSAYLQLYDATGNRHYLDRAVRLARLIRRNFERQQDGTFVYRYWFGLARTGWKASDNISVNTPDYPGQMTIEDMSHLQLSLRFIVECYQRDLVFTRDDLRTWAATFHQKMFVPSPVGGAGTLADNVVGDHRKAKGIYDYAVYGLAMLSCEDPSLLKLTREIYEKEFTPIADRPVSVYAWAVLARLEAASTP